MSAYHLRCRVCEEVTEPEPLDACRRCDGPTDVTYDWDRVARVLTRDSVENGPETLGATTGPCRRAPASTSVPAGRRSFTPSRCRTSSASTCI